MLSWSPTASANGEPSWLDRGDKYDELIEKAVKRWWGVYQYPLAWKAQIAQESRFDCDAVSPAGAMGCAQFMPATWRDMERRYGLRASPHDDIAFDWGARYMAIRMRGWKAKRTHYERWKLGLVSYNAGMGNILKAQTKCRGSSTWEQMQPCLHLVTGDANSHETTTYAIRTVRWMTYYGRNEPWKLPSELRRESDRKVTERIVSTFNLRRYFNGTAWCSYWQPWPDEVPTGWVSADHCHRQMLGQTPPYIGVRVAARNDRVIDAVFYSPGRSEDRPRAMREGEDVYIVGYPGASDEPSLRRGRVYLKRSVSASDYYSHPATIVVIETQSEYTDGVAYEPVIGGMSGGAVVSTSYEPLGVLVTQNGLTDLTGDGLPDSSSDVVELHDAWGMTYAEIIE